MLVQIQRKRKSNSNLTLLTGELAYIRAISPDCKAVQRLYEMGLTPGQQVSLVRTAPLGDPVEIEIRGYHLTLRKEQWQAIELSTHAPAIQAHAYQISHIKKEIPKKETTSKQAFRVGIIGNPNSGKSTLFHGLSDKHVKIGNYPGVTVDKLSAQLCLGDGLNVELIDLPGCYSLYGRSKEEMIAAEFILSALHSSTTQSLDAVIFIIDATALERSCYLLLQVLELGVPVLAVLNMMDEAKNQNIHINTEQLRACLGIPIVETTAKNKIGLDKVKQVLIELIHEQKNTLRTQHVFEFSPTIEQTLHDLKTMIWPKANQTAVQGTTDDVSQRGLVLWSLMYLNDTEKPSALHALDAMSANVKKDFFDAHKVNLLQHTLALSRFAWIDKQIAPMIQRPKQHKHTKTEHIDRLLTHPIYGTIAFLVCMGFVFQLLFSGTAPMVSLIESLFNTLGEFVKSAIPSSLLGDFLVDGVLAGVSTVLAFLPQIAMLLLLISLLESVGYLSRAAFLIDRIMKMAGLTGKAFVPMLSGYACAVPAIMSLRTLERPRDRLLTMMVVPLMSCSARLPVYVLILSVLYSEEDKIGFLSKRGLVLFGIYVVSAILSIVVAAFMNRLMPYQASAPFMLELPPYRLPNIKVLLHDVYVKSRDFVKTVSTTIVVLSACMWCLFHFPRVSTEDSNQAQAQLTQSYAGQLGKKIEPLIAPLGFDWKIGVGLLGAFAAREVFVSTMAVAYGDTKSNAEDSTELASLMRQEKRNGQTYYQPHVAFSLLIFVMLSCQCMSTLAVVRRETKSWTWPVVMFSYMLVLAYASSFLVYQIGEYLLHRV